MELRKNSTESDYCLSLLEEKQKKFSKNFAFFQTELDRRHSSGSSSSSSKTFSRSGSLSSTSSCSPPNYGSSSSSSESGIDEDDEESEKKQRRLKRKFIERDRNNELKSFLKLKSLRHSSGIHYSTMSSSTLIKSNFSPESISKLAKGLQNDCDRILNKSTPFTLDSTLLWNVSQALNQLLTRGEGSESKFGEVLELQLLFLSDFFEQTPSLSISLTEVPSSSSMPGSLDLTLFRSLEFLELRKIPPHMLSGLNTIRVNLKKLKFSRCLSSLSDIFTPLETYTQGFGEESSLTSIWPELVEIDLSFNRLESIESAYLECTPKLDLLNLSRNQITSIDSSFSRILNSLTVLNLNYNQLSAIPPLPPNLKVLLMSNNYVANLASFSSSAPRCLERVDLSQNVISGERELEPLQFLSSLKILVLLGNPIAYGESYRRIVGSNLCRNVVNSKDFTLDGKKLSGGEVRSALEQIKRRRPLLSSPHFKSSSSSGFKDKSKDKFSDLKSLTQSYDSSSSSILSGCRKKAKMREVVILDDVENEDDEKKSMERDSESPESSIDRVSVSSELKQKTEEELVEKGHALESLREKYGKENWLLREGASNVMSLLNMESKPVSRSLPGVGNFFHLRDSSSTIFPTSPSATFPQNYTQNLDVSSNSIYYSALSDPLSPSCSNSNSTLHASQNLSQQEAEMSKNSEGLENCPELEEGGEFGKNNSTPFYTCGSETSLKFTLGEEEEEEFSNKLNDEEKRGKYFRVFASGKTEQLVILDNNLYHIEPESGEILLKWDLKSLKEVQELKRHTEAESVEFSLSFETLRKNYRERSFIMSLPEFSLFESAVSPLMEARTLAEFSQSYQCVKCNSQFSKGMAKSKVMGGGGNGLRTKVVKEVPICPNDECGSEFLVPLDSIPLPNNEKMDIASPSTPVGGRNPSASIWDPILTSTPLSVFFGSKPLPMDSGISDSVSRVSSSIGSVKSSGSSSHKTEEEADGKTKNTDNIKYVESDIETLSCDSSSIEVLPHKSSGTDSSGSDIVAVEEGIEIFVPELSSNTSSATNDKLDANTLGNAKIQMTDSTSSGSCSGSICTQYEKTITSQTSLSQQALFNATKITSMIQSIKYDYENYNSVDHRLQLFVELSVLKEENEFMVALAKVLVLLQSDSFQAVVIFSNKKVYFYKISGIENEKPETWLVKHSIFPIGKLSKLDVLIGRHGIGLDFPGKYFALMFRDSVRTSKFIEFFLNDICSHMEVPCLVQDFSQSQKTLMSPTDPIGYFGVLRHAYFGSGEDGIDKSYALSAILLTSLELILIADLNWMVNRDSQRVDVRHARNLSNLRQVESLEIDTSFVRLLFNFESKVAKWELCFETDDEKSIFIDILRTHASNVPFILLSQPLEA